MGDLIKDPRIQKWTIRGSCLDVDAQMQLIGLASRLHEAGYPAPICEGFSGILVEIMERYPSLSGQFPEAVFNLTTRMARKNELTVTVGALESFLTVGEFSRESCLIWVDIFSRLLELAPRHIEHFLVSVPWLLKENLITKTENWIVACCRGSGLNSATLARHLRLETAASIAWLSQEIETVSLSSVLKKSLIEVQAMWGLSLQVAEAPVPVTVSQLQRTSFFGTSVRMPRSYPGIKGELADAIHIASLHHVAAHLQYRKEPFVPGSLKPIQIALVSVLEDCRCELLACQEFPGLRNVWNLFNIPIQSKSLSAENVFKRLSYKLLNPSHDEGNGWILKAFEAFYDQRDNWLDSEFTRDLGNRLGNDLGQMRIQFNAKTYLPAPIYRDDNQGLWSLSDDDLTDVPESSQGQGVEVECRDTDHGKPDSENNVVDASKKVDVIPLDTSPDATVIATQGEYDYLTGLFLNDFVTVKSYSPDGRSSSIDRSDKFEKAVEQIAALVKGVSVNRHSKKRGVSFGDRLNLDSAISAFVDIKLGSTADERYYDAMMQTGKSLSVQLILDVSESTRDVVDSDGKTLLSVAKRAVDALSLALDRSGDPFGLFTFCSDGREDVRVSLIKSFSDDWLRVRAKLYQVEPGYSTRTGAALRFAGSTILREPTHRKLVILITDGEPFDLDVADTRYFIEDARYAVGQLRQLAVDVHCISIGSRPHHSLERVYGKGGFSVIGRIDQLAERVARIYAMLSK